MEDEKDQLIDPSLTIEEQIEKLKQKAVEVPEWDDIEKEYDPEKHPIVADPTLRPDEKVRPGTGKREVPAKVTYDVERIINRRMVQMALTIPVKRIYNTLNESGKDDDPVKREQAKAVESIYKNVRINGVNTKRMKAYFAACEILTIWYAVEGETVHNKYGFPTKFKLRCRSYSPMPSKWSRITHASLFPVFDEYDDMIAMSFEYTREVGDDTITYFETYTNDTHYKWSKGNGDWEEVMPPETIIIQKHPLIYLWRPLPIWEGCSNNRNEIEFTLSRQSDVIRKNVAPIIKVKGKLLGDRPVGDQAREVYQVEADGDVDTVAPAINHESAKYYVAQLKENIEEDSQMPNLSLENVKGLGAISGEARKTLLTDPHMKVGEEQHDMIEFLDRECNVIKAFLGMMNVKWKESIHDLEVDHVITPFIQNDKQTKVKELTEATGGKAIKSQRTAVSELGDVDDIDAEIAQIHAEEKAMADSNRMEDVFTAGS